MFEVFKAGNVVESGTSNLTGFTKLCLEKRPNGRQ
jgi:hypothetical protein